MQQYSHGTLAIPGLETFAQAYNQESKPDNTDSHSSVRSNSFSDWMVEDTPRGKLIYRGKSALSDCEILSLVLGRGSQGNSALDLSKQILSEFNNNLVSISKASLSDLTKFKGIGEFRATQLLASFELVSRILLKQVEFRKKITKSSDAFDLFRALIGSAIYEQFWMICLDQGNHILKTEKISEGGISGTLVDPKKVLKFALDCHASSTILGHNHPSGNRQPSEADKTLTKKLKDAFRLMDIDMLDHLIVTDLEFFSFADEGMV